MTQRYFGLAPFVADRASMDTAGTGIQIDWSKFTDPKYGAVGKRSIPAGTAVEPTAEAKAGTAPAMLCGPADTARTDPAFLLKTPAIEESRVEAASGYGAYTGGVVYETYLPDAKGRALSTELKAKLTRFTFLKAEDKR
ncbi:hypothetical protein [Deinococcus sp. Marseille-Q6407]|uniref:hypothetical protein n=1 Tax=Deinococcus sp. Marseille-Q6407 TaxID=2969223 RepID=UPI0021C0263B|nr:hypothetical protein [Deinococcus sp. Marseille-Q6407]